MAHRLNPLRAYQLGYLSGLKKARAELRALAASMDEELASLADEIGEIDREYRSVRELAEAMIERSQQARLSR